MGIIIITPAVMMMIVVAAISQRKLSLSGFVLPKPLSAGQLYRCSEWFRRRPPMTSRDRWIIVH